MFSQDSFLGRHKILRGVLFTLAALILIGFVWLQFRMRGPYHNYELDFLIPDPASAPQAGQLRVGVAKRDISPDFDRYDTWVDVNENNRFDPDIDTFEDRTGTGRFDGIWLAGFGTNRPAKGINDPLWVRAMALENNGVLLVMVTVDSVGIFHNDFITIRKAVDPGLGIDHIMFSSTHNHNTPDTMKIWSFGFRTKERNLPFIGRIPELDIPYFRGGYAEHYLEMVQEQSVAAIEEAVMNLAPADMYCAQVHIDPEGFVADSRKPIVMDKNMYLWRFTKPDTDDTIATFVSWGNHPETLGGSNPIITADFVHWLQKGIEEGVPEPNGVEGFGGMALFFQGQLGGLMNPLSITVPHRDGEQFFREHSFEKAESLGYNLAIVAANTLRSDRVWKNENPLLAVAARTAKAPMAGHYKYAIMLGLIHEGYYWGGKAKTEINVIRIGEVTVLTVPGEIYPEIVEGGIEALPGNDFGLTEPVEVPPLRVFLEQETRMGLVIGLANDQIGYIVPKSQWDTRPPHVYNDRPQYGEGNSGGPEVAPAIHRESRRLLEEMNAAFPR